MPKAQKSDICIIGAGPAGLAVAIGAAAYGARVVVVDKMTPAENARHGDLAAVAFHATAGREEPFNSRRGSPSKEADQQSDFKSVMAEVATVLANAAPSCSPERLAAMGITFIHAEARFIGRATLLAGETEIRARRFVLATGSVPEIPAIAGLDEIGFLTSDTVFGHERRPAHLVILGGDAAALELAQTFRRLGSQVTLLAESILPGDDPEMATVLLRRLREEGVMVREGVTATSVERRGKTGVKILTKCEEATEEVNGSKLLIAMGRIANVDGLDLKKARVALRDGSVDVSAMLRTTNRRIYAVGDVTGSRSTPASLHQAELVLKALLFRLPAKDRASIPHLVRTDPELAHIGLTEHEAKRNGKRIAILRWPYAENDKARATGRTEGHIKLVLGRKGEILGVTIAGANASEMMAMWSLAMARGLTLRDVASSIPLHPTTGEIGKSAAMSYFAERARRSFWQVVVRLLRLFG